MSDQQPSDSGAALKAGAESAGESPAPQAGTRPSQSDSFAVKPETMATTLEDGSENPAKSKKKATKLKLQIAHQTHGRVRMKVPSAKGNPDLLREIGETFSVIPGIERVTVSEATGSVILHYDTDHHAAFNERLSQRFLSENQGYRPPTTEIDDLASKIQSEAEFLASHSESAKAVVDFFKHLDREVKIASGNVIDLKILLAVGIVGLTVFELGASAATPVWLTLTVFSLNHVLEMQKARVHRDARPCAGRLPVCLSGITNRIGAHAIRDPSLHARTGASLCAGALP